MLKRREFLVAAGGSAFIPGTILAQQNSLKGTPIENIKLTHLTDSPTAPIVYYCPKVDPQDLIRVFKAVGRQPEGRVGLKMNFSNWRGRSVALDPKLIKPLIGEIKATMIDSNYMDSARSTTEAHLDTAKKLGFTEAGPIEILDTEGEMEIPVNDGYHLKNFITGKGLAHYDTLVSIVRFKGHHLARYGGTMKNLSICLGTARGARQVHSAGKSPDSWSPASDKEFSESMSDAVKAALDYKKDRWVFISVINALEPDDSCGGAKNIGNIGMLASVDPIALDRASADMVYGFAPDEQTRKGWEQMHGTDSMEYAAKAGVGSLQYRLVVI